MLRLNEIIFVRDHPVLALAAIFVLAFFSYKCIADWLLFWWKSNIKYRFIDNIVAPGLHYGKAMGVETVLKLDGANSSVIARRVQGQAYLASRLGGHRAAKEEAHIDKFDLSSALVDCRFLLQKVCMPILRELEFNPSPRNFVANVTRSSGGGMLNVVDRNCVERPYVGNDAVQTLGVDSFYRPIQNEINMRMTPGAEGSMLRFAPTSLTPALEHNVRMLLKLTSMEQVRYCLSGSEAIDAAIKDVWASVRPKKLVVRFNSAYHGHVSGISFVDCPSHIFLLECNQSSIDFIERYHHRIAAVVVNPMQHFTGINMASPPGEKTNTSSRIRRTIARDDYARWLHDLQRKCNYCTKYLTRVAMIVDDIYFAFRTPELFSTKYFAHPETGLALRPDVLVLGKGVAAGYPLSVVLGRKGYLNSYDKKYLLQLNKTVGTFAAWHGGIIASNVLLESIIAEDENCRSILERGVREQLTAMVDKFELFTQETNVRLSKAHLPIRVRNFSNAFSIDYLSKSEFSICRYEFAPFSVSPLIQNISEYIFPIPVSSERLL